jgi:uncharacterized protein
MRSAAVFAGAALIAGVAASAAATYFARLVVSPRRSRPDDVEILGYGTDTVILRSGADTAAPGRFGVWLDGGRGHVRLGPVVDHDPYAGTVTRTLLGVDSGALRAGPGRWNQYYYAGTPKTALGLTYHDVGVPTTIGPMPAWYVPPHPDVPARDTWVILVHGRGATREECLRALPVLHRLGFPTLTVSYRNDAEAEEVPTGRYHLGEAEWRDVQEAAAHAVRQGAQGLILFGWSMGGAITLQLLARSPLADRVRAVVLDAPVLDWRDVLRHQARMNRVPTPLGRLSESVLEHRHGRRLVGIETPLSLDRLDWVGRAAELSVPVLVLHSEDDEYVPVGPSRALARARPEIVTFVPSFGARHTQEWNLDPQSWETAVARFLLEL